MQPILLPRSERLHDESRRKGRRKLWILAGSGVAAVLVGLVLFIKLDTAAAAQFTDNVLRPILGPTRVVALERYFYNGSDALNRLTANGKQQDSPLTVDTGTPAALPTVAPGLSQVPVSTRASTPLPGEGQWKPLILKDFPGLTVAEQTFIRPDPDRSFAYATMVQMDMAKLQLFSVAGTKEPGGKVGAAGPGVIPADVQSSGNLVAAFDGGFQYSDGQYGMIVGSQTYLPLQKDLATLVGYKDGSLKIVKYEGQTFGSDVLYVRQNCPMLIENGQIGLDNEVDKKLWGRTLTSDIYTWRSGIGLTANGNLIYAVGNSLTPSTLASSLKAAGAVNAMQLDINPFWVRFTLFDKFKNGAYHPDIIMKGMYNGYHEFLTGDTKDFFYVTKK